MISEKHIEKINKIIKDMVFDFYGEIITPGFAIDFQYQFEITGQKKMISVGELYDYLTVSVEIVDGNDKATKIFAVLTELNTNIIKDYRLGNYLSRSISEDLEPFFTEGENRVIIDKINISDEYQDKINEMLDTIKNYKKQDEVNESKLLEDMGFNVSSDKYIDLIKKAVLDYVDFDLCKLVVKKIDNTKNQYFIVMMVDEPLKTSYREELQDYLNDIIPLTIYVSISDGMGCKKFMEVEYPKQLSESKVPPQVLRRHHLIDEMFEHMRSRYHRLFCNYRNPNILLGVLYERTLEDLYHSWFYQTVSDDDWDYASEYIQKYLKDKYEKQTVRYWENECKRRSGLYETELTERCWKGYTQKGMKTMFGKRYPNCVKKKK
jgi:hypothetical protein